MTKQTGKERWTKADMKTVEYGVFTIVRIVLLVFLWPLWLIGKIAEGTEE